MTLMSNTELTAKEIIVFDLIRDAAQGGRPCPRNKRFAAIFGSADIAGVSRILRALEHKGLITVEARGRLPRVVTLLPSGLKTYDVREARVPRQRPSRPLKPSNFTVPVLAPCPFNIRPGFEAPPAATCQFIDGDAAANPRRCGAPVFRRSLFQIHFALCYRRTNPPDDQALRRDIEYRMGRGPEIYGFVT